MGKECILPYRRLVSKKNYSITIWPESNTFKAISNLNNATQVSTPNNDVIFKLLLVSYQFDFSGVIIQKRKEF